MEELCCFCYQPFALSALVEHAESCARRPTQLAQDSIYATENIETELTNDIQHCLHKSPPKGVVYLQKYFNYIGRGPEFSQIPRSNSSFQLILNDPQLMRIFLRGGWVLNLNGDAFEFQSERLQPLAQQIANKIKQALEEYKEKIQNTNHKNTNQNQNENQNENQGQNQNENQGQNQNENQGQNQNQNQNTNHKNTNQNQNENQNENQGQNQNENQGQNQNENQGQNQNQNENIEAEPLKMTCSENPAIIEISDDEEEDSDQETSQELDQLALIRKQKQEEFMKQRPTVNIHSQKHSGNFHVNANLKDQLRNIRLEKRKQWMAQYSKKVMTIQDLEGVDKKRQEALAEWGTGKMSPEMIKVGKEALRLTNEFRKQNNLMPLEWNQTMADIGQVHSKNMAEYRLPFGHEGFNDRVKQFPFPSSSAAENVARCNHNLDNAAKVSVEGWIKSPGHRKNLLSRTKHCGIGVYRNAEGKIYLTQLFAA